MKRLIPANREEDVLSMYWSMLRALESEVVPSSRRHGNILNQRLVEAGYRQLTDIGYIKGGQPPWVAKEGS